MRKKPTQATINRLLTLSGNRCAFPGCEEPLTNEDGGFIGEVCHIEAAKPGGQRYNPEQTDDDRRSLSNLLLLCANHHKVTDNTDRYDVASLIEMKLEHEKKYLRDPYTASDKVKEQLDRILEITENPRSLNSYSVEIITDDQHLSDMAEVQKDFERQVQQAMSRFPGSSAQVASRAHQELATKKRRALMRKKANSDKMYELERKDVEDKFEEMKNDKLNDVARRGLAGSGIGMQEIGKIEARKERELEKLKIKYGKMD